MKFKTMFLVMALCALIIGCSNDDTKKEEENRIKEEVTTNLMGKDWVSETVRGNNGDTVKIKRILTFNAESMCYEKFFDSISKGVNIKGHSTIYGSYSISKDGLLVHMVVSLNGTPTLNYSQNELSGLWGKENLVFKATKKAN